MAVWSGWVDLAGATRLVSRGWLQFAIYYKGDCSCTSKWCSAAHFRLSDTYKKATAAAVPLAPTVEQASALRKTLQQPGHSHGKGVQEPQIQRFNNTILTASHGSSSMAERKIVKRLARLHEFNRLAKKAIRDNDVHYLSEGSAQLWTLANKLWPEQVTGNTTLGHLLRTVQAELPAEQANRRRVDEDQQKQRLDKWRDRMRSGDTKNISRWLRHKENHTPASPSHTMKRWQTAMWVPPISSTSIGKDSGKVRLLLILLQLWLPWQTV